MRLHSSTASATFFDTAYLVDDKGNDVFAYRHGEALDHSLPRGLRPGYREMIAHLPSDGRRMACAQQC